MIRMIRMEGISCSLLLATVLAAVALSACASAGAASPHGGKPHGAMTMKDCPMHDGATTVSVVDLEGGVALTFTTAENVDALRAHVAHMAEEHNRKGMMDARAVAEDVDGGARLVLTPNDPAQLATLRDHARAHAEGMRKGDCPMMKMHGHHAEGAGEPPREDHESHEGHVPPTPR